MKLTSLVVLGVALVAAVNVVLVLEPSLVHHPHLAPEPQHQLGPLSQPPQPPQPPPTTAKTSRQQRIRGDSEVALKTSQPSVSAAPLETLPKSSAAGVPSQRMLAAPVPEELASSSFPQANLRSRSAKKFAIAQGLAGGAGDSSGASAVVIGSRGSNGGAVGSGGSGGGGGILGDLGDHQPGDVDDIIDPMVRRADRGQLVDVVPVRCTTTKGDMKVRRLRRPLPEARSKVRWHP